MNAAKVLEDLKRRFPRFFLYEFIAFKGDLRLALIKMEEHKSVTVQVDKAAGKIYVDGVLPNATLCLYHIRGKVIEVKQAREESASFDLPCSGEYVLVITHTLQNMANQTKRSLPSPVLPQSPSPGYDINKA